LAGITDFLRELRREARHLTMPKHEHDLPDLNLPGFSWHFANSLRKNSGYHEGTLLGGPHRRAADIKAQVAFIRSNIQAGDQVLEIGTNCGHFCYVALLLNVASIVTIELRQECAPAIQMLARQYSQINSIFGDSAHIVPRLPGPFDVVWIDGCHKEAAALTDLQNCAGKTPLILVDDFQLTSVRSAVYKFSSESDYLLADVSDGKRLIAKLIKS